MEFRDILQFNRERFIQFVFELDNITYLQISNISN